MALCGVEGNEEVSVMIRGDRSTLIALPFVKVPHFIPHKHEPASLRFKLMAWVVIATLIAFFVLMVWHGNVE